MNQYSKFSLILLRNMVRFLSVSMFIISSGAFLPLIKNGGAQTQGFSFENRTSSFIDKLPLLWLLAAMATFLFYTFATKFRLRHFSRLTGGLLVLCLLSGFWADQRIISFTINFMNLAMSFLLIHLEIKYFGINDTLRSLRALCTFIVITSCIAIFLIPSYGISIDEGADRWQGVFDHKNGLGNFAAFSVIFFLTRVGKLKPTDYLYCGLVLLLVYGTTSTTAAINLLLITFISTLIRFRFFRGIAYKSRYFIIILLVIFNLFIIYTSLNFSHFSIGEKDSSMSGRNMIWLYILSKAIESPWLGFGFGQLLTDIVTNDADFFNHVGFTVGTAHNGFVQTVFELGLVGVGFMIAILFAQVKLSSENKYFNLCLVTTIAFIFLNSFESRMVSFNVYFVFLMYAAMFGRQSSHVIDTSDG